jgi:hypothetical protein
MNLRARRLEDRIRELCTEAVAADDCPRVKSILSELRSTVHQYTQRLRARAAAILTGRDFPPERRRNSDYRGKDAT